MPAPAAIATPCVKVCIVDGESGLCLGWLRTRSEIAGWSAGERERLMAEVPGGRDRFATEKLGPG